MSEECDDLLLAHVTWVALAVEENEAPTPVQISLLGTQTIAPRPHESAKLIEQFGLAGRSGLRCNRFQFRVSVNDLPVEFQSGIRRRNVRDFLRTFVYFSLGDGTRHFHIRGFTDLRFCGAHDFVGDALVCSVIERTRRNRWLAFVYFYRATICLVIYSVSTRATFGMALLVHGARDVLALFFVTLTITEAAERVYESQTI
jgi:hypothetical protein